ncbi:hypothetical protein [Clostridium beijerinckii]|uniref:hypothetical protein n=1 Tax=Clostridium beijerinckii TaxID=1520 RepID=UPI0003D3A0F3
MENFKSVENKFIDVEKTALVLIDLQNGIVNRELSLPRIGRIRTSEEVISALK